MSDTPERGHGPLTILVCSTCGGGLRGRTCENGHNSYPASKIEVIPASKLEAEVEWLRERADSHVKNRSASAAFDVAADRLARLLPGAEEENE